VSQQTASTPTLTALREARAAQDHIWRWMRWLGPLLTAGVALAVLRTSPTPAAGGVSALSALASLAAFVFGALGTLYRESGTRAHTVSAIALVAGAVTLLWTQSDRSGFIALFVAMFLLARRLPTRLAITLSAVAMAFLVLAGSTMERQSWFSGLLTALAIAGFAGLTMLSQRLSDVNEQAEKRLEELERALAAETRAAALAERQHLAREMHDVLAHSLAGLMLQLEGARLLAIRYGADPRLPEAIERAHQLGKSGLDEARQAIETLRGGDLPGPDRLEALARRCEESLGIPCRLTVHGEPVELASQARLAIYRVAQEALTNIAKHASSPESVEVTLAYSAEGATLTVEDFSATPMLFGADEVTGVSSPGYGLTGMGERADPMLVGADEVTVTSSPGYGLTGMRERAELLGGELEAGPTGTGFLVRLKVPA
jgi:signal transduction histidine kinase